MQVRPPTLLKRNYASETSYNFLLSIAAMKVRPWRTIVKPARTGVLCISTSECMVENNRKHSKSWKSTFFITRGSSKAHEEKWRKKFVGQQLRVTPKSWLLTWNFVVLCAWRQCFFVLFDCLTRMRPKVSGEAPYHWLKHSTKRLPVTIESFAWKIKYHTKRSAFPKLYLKK